MSLTKRRLPIGIQTFRRLREDGCYYVDKTDHVRRLVAGGSRYFLSRPRRFGKSLLIDTLKELFEGSRELFEGLRIHAHWDWSVRFPVVRLDFSGGGFADPGALHANVMAQLDEIERGAPVETRYDTAPERFRHLIRTLHRGTGRRVVVLVDEYDKPILDALGDPELARRNRDYLRGLYGGVKFCDAQVKFCLLTGVSRFSKVSLFSELNNLADLTLDPRYSTICGYTEADLDRVFAPELAGLDRERIREWYNGYAWRGAEKVYNPFDVLLLFDSREFEAHWFETATPSFLVETLTKRRVGSVEVECMAGTRELLSTFDVERIEPEALLFQTGYLTIRGEEDRGGRPLYRLGYPNREVRESLNEHLLRAMTPAESRRPLFGVRLRELFAANDFAGIEALFRAFFSSIPHDWHRKSGIARYEGWYASVFYSHFAAAGLDVAVEDATSRGRVDMAVRFEGRVYLFEFKVVELAPRGAALEQLKAKGYADKYRRPGRPIYLVAVECSRRKRNLTAFDVEPA